MSDGVTTNVGSGGPVIATEACGAGSSHLQRIKIVLGELDTDGGDVSLTNPVPTKPVGSVNFATAQGSVTNSASSILAARSGRISATIFNPSAVGFFIGGAGVTAATGKSVPAYSSIPVPTQAAIYAITASGTATFDLMEFY